MHYSDGKLNYDQSGKQENLKVHPHPSLQSKCVGERPTGSMISNRSSIDCCAKAPETLEQEHFRLQNTINDKVEELIDNNYKQITSLLEKEIGRMMVIDLSTVRTNLGMCQIIDLRVTEQVMYRIQQIKKLEQLKLKF